MTVLIYLDDAALAKLIPETAARQYGWETDGAIMREATVRPGDRLHLSVRLLSSSTRTAPPWSG